MPRRKRRVSQAVRNLYKVYLELPEKDQSGIEYMLTARREEIPDSYIARPFIDLVHNTVTRYQFETLKSMVIEGSALESEEHRQKRIRRQRKDAAAELSSCESKYIASQDSPTLAGN